ncbi:tautomerase family protein [Larsenimonas rhizosphaerae]|uniref:Tautomerase family protein n=1 Tax=Larsenimonas rhizosphaerae TaxID=2944682 RepID=A0AA41ZG84_9GAMM|nr:tautomerase family protein [Larsenimonas rhizosphaerae]MCX2523975.1 tautomerase family protein [Larsenimonas rhizosphaerae]
MPLVTISITEGLAEHRKDIADLVNASVIRTMDFPDDDRYHLINTMTPDALELQTRQGERVALQLTMRSGRTDAQKKAFYQDVVAALSEKIGVSSENVMIVITENQDIDWSFSDGIAQFVTD